MSDLMKRQFTFGEIEGTLKEKIDLLKKETNFLENILTEDIQNIILLNSDAYVLLKSGKLFANEQLIEENVKEIWVFQFSTLLVITFNQEIICKEQKAISDFICDKYKKIVTGENILLCLSFDGTVKILTSLEECVGISCDNFIDVSDIGIELNNYEEKAYVIKNKKKNYLFIEND